MARTAAPPMCCRYCRRRLQRRAHDGICPACRKAFRCPICGGIFPGKRYGTYCGDCRRGVTAIAGATAGKRPPADELAANLAHYEGRAARGLPLFGGWHHG